MSQASKFIPGEFLLVWLGRFLRVMWNNLSEAVFGPPHVAKFDASLNLLHDEEMKKRLGDLIYEGPDKPYKRGEVLYLKRGPVLKKVTYLERIRNGHCKIYNEEGLIESVFEFELLRTVENEHPIYKLPRNSETTDHGEAGRGSEVDGRQPRKGED